MRLDLLKYRMKIRAELQKAPDEILKITREELKRETERRQKKK